MSLTDLAGFVSLGIILLAFLIIVIGTYSDEIIEIIRAIKE